MTTKIVASTLVMKAGLNRYPKMPSKNSLTVVCRMFSVSRGISWAAFPTSSMTLVVSPVVSPWRIAAAGNGRFAPLGSRE